ncbi:WecB/TagA/CpsF family glycosyltransferase [Ciceribacter thiooxidans]|uniref:WecB/TagA/CpsF family glycosyltransferase n=1 Tax=Ciceribacter thiooxidans TaxID=1969821 RepID=A0ABV7HUZ0_9HYPH|nr:WecB/TagA/CpsF family glycosyltransferase [Ciceribacter thiooxidans]
MSWQEALAHVSDVAASSAGQTQIFFLNANNANITFIDPEYRQVLEGRLILPDGIGMDIASKSFNGVPFAANLNGTDFVPALLTYMAAKRRIGLIGGHPDVLSTAAARLREHSPWHEIIEIADGFFDKDDSGAVLEKLAAAKIDVLLVAMGTPLQEKWIGRHITEEHARVVIGVGALFDFLAGRVPRAPEWVRRLRCEWAYRLWIEPKRLWYRYVVGIPVFLFRVAWHKIVNRGPQEPGSAAR